MGAEQSTTGTTLGDNDIQRLSLGHSTAFHSGDNLTKALFDRRMRVATVFDTETGAIVGEVTAHPDTGVRVWCAADE